MMQTVAEAMLQNKNLNSSPFSKSHGIQVGFLFSSLVPPGYRHLALTNPGCLGLWRTLVRFPAPGVAPAFSRCFWAGRIAALAFLRRLDAYADAGTSARGSNSTKRARNQKT
jgi:hypothetical protein